jgi:E3 ubiquitin-protein ligase MUL1
MYAILTGVRQQGVQVTEDMLREGKLITGIGELVSENGEHGLKLQPPSDGSPFYLTILPVPSLIRRLDNQMRLYKYVQSISLTNF